MTEHTLHFHRKSDYRRIGKDNVVTLRSAVFDADSGDLIEFRHDLTYLHGGYGGAPAKVEQALEGLEVDMKVEVSVTAEDGFGSVDPDKRIVVPLSELPEALHKTGAVVDAEAPGGDQIQFRVTAIEGDMARLDANHPLAGRALRFVLEVREIRAARGEEIQAGYAFRDSTATPSSTQ